MPVLLAQRLSDKIERGAQRTVMHPSRVKRYSVDGRLGQTFGSGRLKHMFNVGHGLRNRNDFMDVLSAFYAVMGGSYAGLLFRDWADYEGFNSDTALDDLGGGTWQLERIYTFGAVTYHRKITRPSGTIVVNDVGGLPLTSSVDPLTGIATVTGSPVTWVGKFDVPVTFKEDEWTASLEVATQNLYLNSRPVDLEEIFE